MKIWIKLLAGIIIGALLGKILPLNNGDTSVFFLSLSEIVISIGRYCIYPLLFFSLIVGSFRLKLEGILLRVYGRTVGYLLLSTALLILIGTISVLLFFPEGIHPAIQTGSDYSIPGVSETIMEVFPRNFFMIFVNDGNFILPLCFFAFFFGINLTYDKQLTVPVVQFFDVLSKVFYHINSFIIEVLGLGLIIVSASMLIQLRSISQLMIFSQLFFVLIFNSVILIFGILPGLLYLLMREKQNPYKWLYAIIAPAIAGFISGDSYFSLTLLVRHGKENLGIPRKIGSTTFPLFALFGRAGTALVTCVAFIIVLKSYSRIEISVSQIFWIISFAFFISFVLGSFPGQGAIVSISILCSLFDSGIKEGYLILLPVAFLLVSFGVFLDVVVSAFVSLLVADHENIHKEVDPLDFI